MSLGYIIPSAYNALTVQSYNYVPFSIFGPRIAMKNIFKPETQQFDILCILFRRSIVLYYLASRSIEERNFVLSSATSEQ